MTKEILLIGDFAGVGKVSFSVMTPILTAPGRTLNFLPTAVVSNSFDYGDAVVHELTSFMQETLEMWQKHQFQFDLIVTGFIFSPVQVDIIRNLIKSQAQKPLLIADPIMGDLGELYAGLTLALITGVRQILPLTDLIIPNLTEALLILGKEDQYGAVSEEKVFSWIKELIALGAKSALITSVEIEGNFYIFGYSEKEDCFFKVPYTMVPIHFGGTGDIFTSLITHKIIAEMNNTSHKDSATNYTTLQVKVERSAKTISEILKIEAERSRDRIDEVYLQNHLEALRNIE